MGRLHALLYYYPFVSSRAATILWGRMASCGRLLIGLLIDAPPAANCRTNRMAAI
jgi:hypothetical protein